MPRFARHARLPFEKWVKPQFAGKPVRYLELGVFEGACSRWMFENVLTHLDSRATLVDPWLPYAADSVHIYTKEMMDACPGRVAELLAPWAGRFTIHRQTSTEYLSRAHGLTFELIYQDGRHDTEGVLEDVRGAFPLLAPGGWLVFDDTNEAGVKEALVTMRREHVNTLSLVWATRHQQCYARSSG